MTSSNTSDTVSRRTVLRTVFPIALVGFSGCLGRDENENEWRADNDSIESYITILNVSENKYDMVVRVNNNTLDKQILEETASIPPGDRKRWDFVTEADHESAELLGTLKIENPTESIADGDDVVTAETSLRTRSTSAFSGVIRDDGHVTLTTE